MPKDDPRQSATSPNRSAVAGPSRILKRALSRNWRPYVAASGGLIVVAILATLVYLTGTDLLQCRQPDKPPSYAATTTDKVAQSAARGQTRALPQTIVEQVDCERPGSDRQFELCQQQQVARSTLEATCIARRQGWLSLAGATLSFFALVGLFATVLYARGTARSAAGAADSSKRAADAAEHALRGLERPYLFIEKIDAAGLTDFEQTKPWIAYCVVNYGKTPAILRSINARLEVSPSLPLRLPPGNAEDFYALVQPGKRLLCGDGEGDDYRRLEVWGGHAGQTFLGARAAVLVFHGSIHYEDPTGASYTDRFCMRANPGGESFRLEGGTTYNCREAKVA